MATGKRALVGCLCSFLMCACSSPQDVDRSQSRPPEQLRGKAALADNDVSDWEPDPAYAARVRSAFPRPERSMTCRPREIGPDDLLTIRFEGRHGPEMEIVAPSGRAYFIAFAREQWPGTEPPIDGALFSRSMELKLAVRDIEGLDAAEIRPVFADPGIYTILVARNLETEIENKALDAYCNVTYRPTGPGGRTLS